MNNIGSWFEIYVEDMQRAKAFYEAVTGKTLDPMPMPDQPNMEMMSFAWEDAAPGSAGALVKSEYRKPSSEGTILYFDSADCSVELARVEAAGGKITLPKTPAGDYGFFCTFEDTEGNTVGFFSPA